MVKKKQNVIINWMIRICISQRKQFRNAWNQWYKMNFNNLVKGGHQCTFYSDKAQP